MSKQNPTSTEADNLHVMRHSLAHVMATAIQELWPKAKFGVGPVIDNGFYYDIDIDATLTPDDLEKVSAKMRKVIAADYPFEREEIGLDEAIARFKDRKQTYKVELLNDLKTHGTTVARDIDREQLGTQNVDKVTTVSLYRNGPFEDLCRGPHLESTGKAGAFKLTKVSGAYWRGDANNPQLQRIYGVAFATEAELNNYLRQLEEAEKRDHKMLGQKLELFMFHETAPGMPYWLPKGVRLYNELVNFWRQEHEARGYQEIVSPILNKKELYVTSGHFDHYWDDMFVADMGEHEQYGVKAMNCPNAMIVYGSRQHSYRELPLRLSDTDSLHRYELSGALNGLLRARQFRQDDAHIFVTEDQIQEEYARIFELVDRFYSIFDLQYSFRLGTRPDKFMGDAATWDKAESALKEILDRSGKDYFVLDGDGAFYGPKIDILMEDALGRPWQMGTIQLDFQQPQNFGLTYTDKDGSEKMPIVIHRVIYGSLERFIGVLIEHYAGNFPVWLAPEQVRLTTVNDEKKVVSKAQEMVGALKSAGIRAVLDDSAESVGKKIRAASLAKVPYTIVVGEKEAASDKVAPRIRADLGSGEPTLDFDRFVTLVQDEIAQRSSASSLIK